METAKLSNILKEQKLPLDVAVEQKIERLQSDDAFNPDYDPYISIVRENAGTLGPDDEFLNAFGGDSGSGDEFMDSFNSSSAPRSVSSRPQSQASSQAASASQPAKQMSMAERIAALRGALNVPPEFRRK